MENIKDTLLQGMYETPRMREMRVVASFPPHISVAQVREVYDAVAIKISADCIACNKWARSETSRMNSNDLNIAAKRISALSWDHFLLNHYEAEGGEYARG